MNDIIHLHIHSNYSLLRGVMHPHEIAHAAKEHGMRAAAITDHNSISGAIRFYKACKDMGIHPIIGTKITDLYANTPPCSKGLTETYPETFDQPIAASLGTRVSNYVILLAKNQNGYAETCKLITDRLLDKHFCLRERIQSLSRNVFVITPCLDILNLYPVLDLDMYAEVIYDQGLFQEHSLSVTSLAQRLDIPVTAANAVHFETRSDFSLYKTLRAIDQNTTLSQVKLDDLDYINQTHYFKSAQEMYILFKELPQALSNTAAIAKQCCFEFELGNYKFPKYTPAHSDTFLNKLCFKGLKKRVPELFQHYPSLLQNDLSRQEQVNKLTRAYISRLNYELSIIKKMNFSDYFLVVWDIARKAKQMGIPSIGRGSAANSLAAFCLELTHVDPIQMNLYFERFLNPERTSPPDIDLDFCWKRRQKILNYVFERYGQDHVGMICTTITLGLRSAFREIARVYGLDDREISLITKRFPYFTKTVENINVLKQTYPSCRNIPLEDEPYKSIFYASQRFSAFPRHLSVHPGGIIICDKPLFHYTAQQKSANQLIVTQYDMYSIEDLGLVKIDLLGNRSLSVYQDCLNWLSRNNAPKISETSPVSPSANAAQKPAETSPNFPGRNVTLDMDSACSDPKTKALIQNGDTMGCFYIESPAMRSLLKKLRTSTFEDLTAASSVIRPGVAASGMMDQYIERTRDPGKTAYLHPKLEPLLKQTHGIMIYQEDVLKVAHYLAGMPLAQADLFRRAMSGKARSKHAMRQLVKTFISGCIKNGIPLKTAREIWRQIESFAGYSFCKAHSASYAQLSFKCAYLKCHFPALFMCSVINNGGGFYSTGAYINEARRMGIKILLPCVNASDYAYTWGDQCGSNTSWIRIGLSAIAEVSYKHKLTIVSERNTNGPYSSLFDCVSRTHVSKRDMEALILCGACDCFGIQRSELMYQLSLLYELAEHWAQDTNHLLNTDCITMDTPELDDFSEQEKYHYELTYLGFLASAHPLETSLIKQRFAASMPSVQQYKPAGSVKALSRNKLFRDSDVFPPIIQSNKLSSFSGCRIRILGWCIAGKTTRTRKKNALMKFMSMEDPSGTFEVTVFPEAYSHYAPILHSHGPYLIEGMVKDHFGTASVLLETITLIK
ncbi:DNA polymerase III subunit alpha [Thermoproteota archaeon]